MKQLIIAFILIIFTGFIYYILNRPASEPPRKLKIDLDDIALNYKECASVCSIDESECLRSPYDNEIPREGCSNQLSVCQTQCQNNLRPNTKFLFNYNYIPDRQKAMRKYLCDSNVLVCVRSNKSTNECLDEQQKCYTPLDVNLGG